MCCKCCEFSFQQPQPHVTPAQQACHTTSYHAIHISIKSILNSIFIVAKSYEKSITVSHLQVNELDHSCVRSVDNTDSWVRNKRADDSGKNNSQSEGECQVSKPQVARATAECFCYPLSHRGTQPENLPCCSK